MRQVMCSCLLFLATIEAIPMLMNKPLGGVEKFNNFDYMEAPKSESLWPLSFSNEDPIFRNFERYRNIDVDGVEAQSIPDEEKALSMFGPKYLENFGGFEETSKLPQMPFDGIEDKGFQMGNQPGVAPKFTGTFVTEKPKNEDKETIIKEEDLKELDPDYIDAPITNPANYFLEGADLTKVAAPKCQMIGCTGPHVNDGSLSFENSKDSSRNEQCHQTFVPLNGCLDGKGYPMGMVCQICCDCGNSFVAEMKKSRGFRTGYKDPHQ